MFDVEFPELAEEDDARFDEDDVPLLVDVEEDPDEDDDEFVFEDELTDWFVPLLSEDDVD